MTTITVDPNGGIIGSQQISQLIKDYQRNIAQIGRLPATFAANHSLLRIDAQNRVQINVHATLPQYQAALQTSLQKQGMQVQGVYAGQNMIQGWYPIAGLSTIVTTPHFRDVTPVYKGALDTGLVESQGDPVMKGPTFRQNTGFTGAGITVGVMSDSINQANGGIAASQKTGDLPATVRVLEDLQGGEDEGRAMSEIIYDVAPGASLAFHTAANGPQDFADGIKQLAAAGSRVIVDDLRYIDDPMFNAGIISQAVNTVHGQGVFYASSAGNNGDMGGIFNWSPITATVGGTTGTFFENARRHSSAEVFAAKWGCDDDRRPVGQRLPRRGSTQSPELPGENGN